MSSSATVRTAAAGVLAALLVAGCGGGGGGGGSAATYSVSVAVSGLSGTVDVSLNGGNTLTFTADGTQTFSSMLAGGDIYAVTVGTQPATQYCTVGSNGTGLASASLTVDVTCNASAGGIWTEVIGNDSYVAMADEAGDFWVLDTNTSTNDVYVSAGVVSVSGTTVSGGVDGEALSGTYSDGSYYGTGTLSGTVDARSTLNLTSTFTTSSGTQLQTQLALTYSSTYSEGSSLAAVAGTYSEGTTTFNISSGGTLTATDSSSSCVLNGTVDPIASAYNMYEIAFTYSSCTGTDTSANGLTYYGIGALAPANSTLNSSNVPAFISVEEATLTTGYAISSLNLSLE